MFSNNQNSNQLSKSSSKKNRSVADDNYLSYISSSPNFDYKGYVSLKSAHQLFFQEDSSNPAFSPELSNYKDLYEHFDKLNLNNTPKNIVNFFQFIRKSYYMKQNAELLNIFEEFDLFTITVNFISSENVNVSIEALKFIKIFTSVNDDFAQLFIERNLFGILSNVISKCFPTNWEENQESNDYQYFILTLSILSNLSQFNQAYVKRVWKILTPNLFFTIINNGNPESLLKCTLIAMRSIQRSNITDQNNVKLIKSICQNSIKGLFTLLSHQDPKIVEISLFGILKYFDLDKKSIFEPKVFRDMQIQGLLENFYKSDQYTEIIKAHSLNITSRLLENDLIENFYSESLFALLLDNDYLKLKESAFYCLYMAIFRNKLADQQIFLEFLKENVFKIILECPFANLYYGASAIINFLKKLGINDFIAALNDGMITAMIKLIQFEQHDIQYETLCLLNKFQLENDVILMFTELGGADVLEDIINSDYKDDLKTLSTILQTKYNLGI